MIGGRAWLSACLLAALAALCGCVEAFAPIILDISKNCNEVEVVVIADNLGAASATAAADEIVDTAADGSEAASVWVLVVPGGMETADLQVLHYVTGTLRSTVTLNIPASQKGAVRLIASPTADEVYLAREGPGTFRIWRVRERDPVPFVQTSTELARFPNDSFTCSPCDTTDWYRDLIFLEGEPFLVSVPPFSPTVSISVWVGQLTSSPPDTGPFDLSTEHRLNFEPRCDPGEDLEVLQDCETTNGMISHPSVTVLGRQADPRLPTSAVLATRQRQQLGSIVPTFDVFVVHIGLDEDGVPAGILRSEQSEVEITQSPGPPAGLAVDEFATYALVTLPIEGTRLLRLAFASFEEGFDDLDVEVQAGHRVMQLDNDVALGRIVDGSWEITKLFPDAIEQSRTVVFESEAPIEDFEVAGAGVFLLRRRNAAPQVVRLSCAAPEIPEGQ